jgi:hypothetical protein
MPLRDHFRSPLDDVRSWEELHGLWPVMMVMALAGTLPPRYVAGPCVHLGAFFEIDVASSEESEFLPLASAEGGEEGGCRNGGLGTAPNHSSSSGSDEGALLILIATAIPRTLSNKHLLSASALAPGFQ